MSAVAAVVLATAFFVGDVADGGVRLRSMHRSRRESATSLVPHPAWNVLGAVGVAGAVWALLGGAAGALVGAVAGVVGAVGLRRLLNSAPADRTDSADLAAAWELMAVVPMWTVELLAQQAEGGVVINVTLAGEKPTVASGQVVTLEDLEVIPWNQNGRHGNAFRATAIRPVSPGKGS